MTVTDERPSPDRVSHEPVARIATERAGQLFQDVILRDAKIGELHQYIQHLEDRITELEQQSGPIAPASSRVSRPRNTEAPPEPQQG